MGSCTSGLKNKKKDAPDDKNSTDNKPKEDVTYASIDHSSVRASRRTRVSLNDDCDYATVNIPAALRHESDCSSKEEREDDYVLMG